MSYAGTESEPAPAATTQARRRSTRGRLFRRYFLLILSLVTIALLASSGTAIYFTYQETKSFIASLQHEKALAAASRIEEYVGNIERQLAYAALPQLDVRDVELRRIEFVKLLRQAPEVTDIAQLDAAGHEHISISRLGMDNIGSGKDRSQEAAFVNAKAGQPWFGPVYFRRETEPYLTIALRTASQQGSVIVADLNLKFIWDIVSRIKIGERGKACVVDGNGFLIADPDIGLVLRKTNLSRVPHVKAVLAGQGNDEGAQLSTDFAGVPVLASVAPIDSLRWYVFVEQPVSEVYEKLNAAIFRTGLLLVAGLVISALGALALARGMVRPIRTLEEGTERIGAGNLDQRIEVNTGDELEALANRFNRMSVQLRESYAGLERKVEQRTRELKSSLEQQTAIAEILRVISSSPTDVRPVLDVVARRAAQLCDAAVSGVLLFQDGLLHARTAHSTSGELLPPISPVPLKRTSITGHAILERKTIHHADIVPLLDVEYPDSRENLLGQGARAILAVPLLREGGCYGGIFLFRREPRVFAAEQIALIETFAQQAAIAIDNVRLLNEASEQAEAMKVANLELGKKVDEQIIQLDRLAQLKRFFPREVAEAIVCGGEKSILSPHRREISYVFVDLHGFNAFTDAAEPEEVEAMLHEYHETMGKVIAEYEGTLDRFAGSCILAFFNDPLPVADPGRRAARMSLAMQERFAPLRSRWQKIGYDLALSIGIAQGYCTLGAFGFEGRWDYSAIGSVVNLASRLADEAQGGQVLIDRRTCATLGDAAETEPLGSLFLKGFTQSTNAFLLKRLVS